MGVTFRTNASNLAMNKRFVADKTGDAFRKVMQSRAQKMKATAVLLSSGTLTATQRRQMGYPYALRFLAGAAGQPDYLINIGTGKFRGSWRTRVQKTASGWTLTLWNDSPEATRLLGSDKMRVRPILEEIERRFHGEFPDEVRKVVRRAIRQNAIAAPVGGSVFGGVAYAIAVGVTSAAGGVEDAF